LLGKPVTYTCASWNSNYTTLGSIEDTTDSHVGDGTIYPYKICCKIDFLQDTEPCGGSSLSCKSGSYCSDKDSTGNTIASPHCCSIGDYWDTYSGQCIQFRECNPSPCTYNILTNPVNWFATPSCATPSSVPYSEGCCLVTWFGQPEYAMSGFLVNGR